MKSIKAIIKKELFGYFYSPVAYVFLIIFQVAATGTTFFLGDFFRTNQAGLEIFFLFHPWLYMFLIPAIGMRLWAEEKQSGTIELLFTMPIQIGEAVVGKFIAGWIFIGIALSLTFPIVFTVWYLGNPDNGVIFASYVGSFFMAGAFLSISCVTSAMTRNQVISFILSVIICLIAVLLGWGVFTSALSKIFSASIAEFISNLSFTYHFNSISRGIIDSRDVFYFLSVIIGALGINTVILDSRKSL